MKKNTVIMIANQKGGVGKTSTSKELAYIFGKSGKKVLAVDLDPQMGLTLRTDVDRDKRTVMGVLEGYIEASEAVKTTKYYDMLTGDDKLKNALLVFQEDEDKTALKEILGELDYDVIILDTPPQNETISDMAIIASDFIIVVADATGDALTGIGKMKNSVERYKAAGLSKATFLGSLLTNVQMQFGKPTTSYQERYEELQTVVKDLIDAEPFETYIRQHDKLRSANNAQMAVNEYDATASAAQDYLMFSTEVEQKVNHLQKEA